MIQFKERQLKPLNELDKLIASNSEMTLSANDVCKILQHARKYQVLSLTFAGLDIQFADISPVPEQKAPKKPFKAEKQIPAPTQDEMDKVEDDALLAESASLRQAQLDQMAIEYPEEYEKLMASGDLLERKEDTEDSGP